MLLLVQYIWVYMAQESEVPYLHIEQLEIHSIDQQQALFDAQDHLIRIIEKAFSVSIGLRNSNVEIKGDNENGVSNAAAVIRSLLQVFDRNDETVINDELVYRLIENTSDGTLDTTLKAMENVVTITQNGTPIKCKTLGQKNYVKALQNSIVTICIGPAGTGKTYLAVAQAAEELKSGKIEKIIMSRPAIEAGEERLGFLPGDLAQKVDPYLRPLYDALDEIFGRDKAEKLREKGIVEIAPLAYMRGRTLKKAKILIDESQNSSLSTLKMALTRLGEGSTMVLTGDVTQIDLPHKSDSGLEKCASILTGIEGITVMRLNDRDVVRNKIVKDIVKAFEKAEEDRKPAQGSGTYKQKRK